MLKLKLPDGWEYHQLRATKKKVARLDVRKQDTGETYYRIVNPTPLRQKRNYYAVWSRRYGMSETELGRFPNIYEARHYVVMCILMGNPHHAADI